ncbi:MAG: radical SAM protein [Coriobacteriia bacterium]|nr:radical SAM protein [Coriobacteriia bacterium]
MTANVEPRGGFSHSYNVLPVAERFVSINGEGPHAGFLSSFVRFAGCNLDCTYCDTRWANAADAVVEWLDPEQLCAWVAKQNTRFVTLTGGEPLIQPVIMPLMEALMMGVEDVDDEAVVEIETNGSVPVAPVVALRERLDCPQRLQLTMDWKLPSSGMSSANELVNLRSLGAQDAVKFVAGTQDDLQEALRVITTNGLCERCQVFLSPVQGVMPPAALVDFAKEAGLRNVRVQVQLHKVLWPGQERGV